tara:strand:- start:17872 stop:18195 length:324 start_codon:yes stop_codon:yes gene_type:complete
MKFIETIKKYAWQILAILFVLLFLGKGCTSKKIRKTNNIIIDNNILLSTKVDSLTNVIISLENKTVNKLEVENIMEKVMLNYLIYEDDLDKGKTSLSHIKNKIEAND